MAYNFLHFLNSETRKRVTYSQITGLQIVLILGCFSHFLQIMTDSLVAEDKLARPHVEAVL